MDDHLYAVHESENGGIRLQVEVQPRANYSLILSGIPFIRAVVVHNETGRDLPSIKVMGSLEITGYPEPVPWQREIPGTHAAGSVSRLDRLADFQEFLPVLASAFESSPGRLDLRATTPLMPDVEVRVIADLEVSAFNEFLNWPGLQSSVAAFVQPNTRSITGILRAASEHLLDETGDGALSGYQNGPERVNLIAAAVYEAIRAREVTYINPPASFERTGQKVRTTEQVLTDRFGTCIDLAVLYAACLEAAGLFPVIFITRGHAFGGYYTQEIHGEATLVTEANTVANLVELGTLAPVELTGLNPGSSLDFRQAKASATRFLANRLPEFAALVDVRRARLEGIRPMPHFHAASDPVEDQQLVNEERPFVVRAALDALDEHEAEDVRGVLEAKDDSPARLRSWKRELLDLSLRNPLLNMPRTKKVMDLVVPEGMLARVDDVVHTGKSVRLAPSDQVDAIQVARGVKSAADLSPEDLRSLFDASRLLYSSVAGDACKAQLRSMKREADTLEQETGSNYLYLTLGALVHPKKTGGEARAPLFMLPIRIGGGLASRPFTIALDGEEIAQPNLCLLQWLKTTHGLDLPALAEPAIDDAGIAIQTVFAGIRRALVEANLPYRIDESCSIAILRFSTFQVWKDIDEHWEHLLGNPVVRHLVERPGETFDDPAGDSDPVIDEGSLRLPIAADGSQMAAVMRAASGQSFVLEGPPGTGKSQTITNLIAHALVEGKTVLFVAEKQAALEVVQRRLDAIGIGALAIELHGAKQSMTSIREQLRNALALEAAVDQAAWDAADGAMRAAISQLGSHAGRVHGENPAGHSLWTAYDAVAAAGRGPVATVPHRLVTRNADAPHLDVALATERTRQLQEMSIQLGLQPGHHWLVTGPGDGSPLDAAALNEAARDLGRARHRLASLSPVWKPHLRRFAPDGSLDALVNLLDAGVAGLVPPPSSVPEIDRLAWRESVDGFRQAVATYQSGASAVIDRVRPESLHVANLDALIAQSVQLDGVKFLKGMRQKGILAGVGSHLRDGVAVDGDGLTAFLRSWRETLRDAGILRSQGSSIPGLVLPGDWQATDTDALAQVDRAAYIARLLVWLHGVDPQLATAASQATESDRAILHDVDDSWKRWLDLLGASGVEVTRWAPPSGRAARDWVTAWEQDEPRWLNDLASSGTLQPQRFRELARAAKQLGDSGLEAFATEVLSGSIPPAEVSGSLLRGLATVSIAERLTSGGLDQFDPDAQDRATAAFTRQGQRLRELQATRLAATILAHRPFQATQLRGEVAELKRQLDRKRGGLSFRELILRYPDAITALTPCFLMSPGSVAHFLDPAAIAFDLVIFDEASQIRVPQAIGSMGRGKAVVVVGDSRQMPPTRIMEVSTTGSDDMPGVDEPVVVEDLESILSEAVESGLPQEWLTWHYRSQDESLIAFSNEQYYGDRLVTLPSPGADAATGLSWRRVDGVFDRGRSRTNEIEADAIVDEIVARLANPATRKDSIGVVCFNIQQRDMILNKLEDSADPNIQQALTAEPGDALFVKNLENVQGDERDVILFSLAFSLDPNTGRLPLNFGPLNGSGGERRLNVAVTRARKQVILFSSFDPKDIDLSRSGARGLRDLRTYMEYAAARPVPAKGEPEGSAARSRLVAELTAALGELGYETGTGIGLSTFKVDLAVRKPGDRRWKVAVMVDGPEWASRPTVTDRDGSPQLLVDIMKWPSVVRVWLPGWLRDRDGTITRIRDAVEKAPNAPEPAPLPVTPPTPEVAPSPAPTPVSTARPDAPGEPGVFTPASDDPIAERTVLDNLRLAEPAIRRYTAEILAAEGPTRLDRLTSIIARRFGMRRIGAQKRDEIEAIVRATATITGDKDAFAWPKDIDPATWPGLRRNANASDRALDEISPQEIVNAMTWLLASALSMSRDDLERETLTFFGYVRLTETARSWLAEAIDLAVASGRIAESDGRFRNT